jgi:hypothetical protein
VSVNLVKENWWPATDHTLRQTMDGKLDIDELEGPKSGFGSWDVSDVLGAKAGSLATSDDGEVGMVLGLESARGISMELEESPMIKFQACRQERETN